jgi:quercetin dioxygenase-like cupin family protein
MDYQLTTFEDAPNVPVNLDGKKMFTSEKLEIVHLTLHPGESIPLHSNPVNVVFFIISGTGLLEMEHEVIEGKPNSSIFVKAGVQRGWKNSGTDDFRILVIKELK